MNVIYDGAILFDYNHRLRKWMMLDTWLYTSSTAQGGGGSFKKRKTIGEIGCCESRMSKQKH